MSIEKFKVLNVISLPLGISKAVSVSELSLDARSRASTERKFFRQERNHLQYGPQRIDYYPDEQTAYVECLDTISFLNILEETGLNLIAEAIPPAIIEDARWQLAEEEKIREQEHSDLWKKPIRA